MKQRVYIAGKLNDMAVDYLYNVHKMMEIAEEVRKAGFSVYVPAIDLLMGIKFGYKTYEDYFDNSQPWLVVSDAVFLVSDWEESKGTKEEIRRAQAYGIPIFTDLDRMIEYFTIDSEKKKEIKKKRKLDRS